MELSMLRKKCFVNFGLSMEDINSPAEVDPLAVNVVDQDVAELNAFDPPQMPPQRLELRVGAVVMLLRNVNVQLGLCNGTRMVITELHRNVIRCRIINESSRMYNQVVNLPRFKFEYDPSRHGGADERHFFRTQFPIRLAFAMTINKAQGQTAERVGLALHSEVFGAGQTYVGLSRSRNAASITVFAPNSPIVNGRVRIKMWLQKDQFLRCWFPLTRPAETLAEKSVWALIGGNEQIKEFTKIN
uniref:ATP-dependent DNA helicase n=1 Tax=Ditylenchus dipsaci TaxID=166011 RepID=A0A915DEK9_9BILA